MYKKLLSRWINKAIENAYWHDGGNPTRANTVIYYSGKIRIVATTLSQWSVS